MAHVADTAHLTQQTTAMRAGDSRASRTGMQGPPLSSAPNRPIPITARFRFASADARTAIRRNALDRVYERAANAIEACVPLTHKSVEMTRQAGRRLKAFKDERPLQLIGIIAGSAFTLGVAVRFWRSRHE